MKKRRILTILICITLLMASIFVLSACEIGDLDPNGDNSDRQTVTVSFVVDGSVLTTKTITSGSDITDLPAVPEKTGYNGAWSVSDFTNITTDTTVNAVYTAKTYTLTFDYDGADGNNTQISKTVTYNQTVGDLPVPTKDGFTFGGWKVDGNTITETTTWNIDGDKTAVAVWRKESEGLTYQLNTEETAYTVTGIGTCSDTDLVIPSMYNGLPVTNIGGYAFSWCTSLTSVTIGNGVTNVGDSAFYRCYPLTKVNYTGTIDQWVQIEFDNDNSNPLYYAEKLYINNELVTEANITTATKINDYAFYNCSSLTSVTIGNNVTSIGSSAFEGCDNLQYNEYDNALYLGNATNKYLYLAKAKSTDITCCIINENCKFIGSFAFYDCDSLTSVTIGNNVESIGMYAFQYCYKLVEVINKSRLNIKKDGLMYQNNSCVGEYALNVKTSGESEIVNKDGYLFYTYNNVNYLLGYVGNETNLTLPDSYNGKSYEIYECAFYYCSSLTSIVIPDSVTSIGDYAFSGCSSLQYNEYDNALYLGNATNKYLYLAKAKSTDITGCIINENCKFIGSMAFYCCRSLTSVTIGSNVESIGEYAFYWCYSLTSVTIGNSVESIGYSAFEGCFSLQYNEYDNALYLGNATNKYLYLAGAKSRDITGCVINENCKLIGSMAFYNCRSLTSVTIGSNVESIGEYAFGDCDGLTSVTFEQPDGWYVSYSSTATSGTDLDLTDAKQNATYLKSTYSDYYWYKA